MDTHRQRAVISSEQLPSNTCDARETLCVQHTHTDVNVCVCVQHTHTDVNVCELHFLVCYMWPVSYMYALSAFLLLFILCKAAIWDSIGVRDKFPFQG